MSSHAPSQYGDGRDREGCPPLGGRPPVRRPRRDASIQRINFVLVTDDRPVGVEDRVRHLLAGMLARELAQALPGCSPGDRGTGGGAIPASAGTGHGLKGHPRGGE